MGRLLSSVKKKQDRVFVGTQLPTRTAHYLSMYCLAYDTTKATLLRGLVLEWMDKIDIHPSKLISKIVEKAQVAYSDSPNKEEFVDDLKEELVKDGIDDKTIQKILNKLQNGS
jgi:cation transport regulator ChaC